MNRLLIIDLDSYVYKSITPAQTLIQVKPNQFVEGFDTSKAIKYIDNEINRLLKELKTNNYELVVGSQLGNFRKELYPSYKSNRKPKPLILPEIFKALKKKYQLNELPFLEGDDTCRIMFEDKNFAPDMEKVIVSIDKDFMSVPCKLYRDLPQYREVTEIDIDTARYNLMKQIIMGDTADGYEGIPGYGEVKTEKFLEYGRTSKEVLQLYLDNGLTKEDYIRNKDCATIVSYFQYNQQTGYVDRTKGDLGDE